MTHRRERSSRPSRRRYLAASGAGLAGVLSGCLGDRGSSGSDGPTGNGDPDSDDTPTADLPDSIDGEWHLSGRTPGNTNYAPDASVPEGPVGLGWREIVDTPTATGPAVADGRVFVGGEVAAHDAVNGEQDWGTTTGTVGTSAPALVDDAVIVGSADGSAYAFERDGTERWTSEHGEKLTQTPIAVDGTVVLADRRFTLYGLDPATGETEFTTPLEYYIGAGAVSDGEALYVACEAGILYRVSLDGTVGWSTDLGAKILARPAVDDGTVYVGDEAGRFHALDAATGEERWQVEFGESIVASPAVTDESVVVGSKSGALASLALGGVENWRTELGAPVRQGIVATDESLLAVADDSGTGLNLRALSREGGEERWRFESMSFPTTPALADGVVFWATGGQVMALGPSAES